MSIPERCNARQKEGLSNSRRQVETAIRAGYRHIDCAMIYQNQDEVRPNLSCSSSLPSDAVCPQVGRALKKVIPSVVKREELFITTKLWNTAHKPELVEVEFNESLKQLGLDYVDLYRASIH